MTTALYEIEDDHTIRIKREPLSDGSHVYAVYIRARTGGGLMFPAINETDALCLAYKLADAINTHTNELARVT